ncbi:hypothetical protein RR46_11977 [Papilio xuthus]|uniref:Uncharacterized protein n=1 Tax=Papilio xuthus TaxID=66420 RepID=A0A194PPS4_PAPXU|nr:hypothetical protein RR46_11977 [Papilio xuthus]
MQFSTIIVLVCLIATVVASVHYERRADAENRDFSPYDPLDSTSDLKRSPRMKRGLLLLKKKLLLGALGLKAAKVGAVGAGLAGALALKSKASVPHSEKIHIYYN